MDLISVPGLSIHEMLGLCAVSMFTSALTASVGIGGGVLLLAVMATMLHPAIMIPLHGIVQAGSNLGRTTVMRRHIDSRFIPHFAVGTVIGAAIGGAFVVALPKGVLLLILGAFIIYTVWGPRLPGAVLSRPAFLGLGILATFATMFIGATGPVIMPFIAAVLGDRQAVVATHAFCMVLQHALKVTAFAVLGFAFADYLPLLIGMVVFGFLGTLMGRTILQRMPERFFRRALKIVLTLLAVRLLVEGLGIL